MKKINYLLFLLSLLILIKCGDSKKNEISTNQLDVPSSELIELVKIKGDTLAYDKLRIDYMDSPYDAFLDISILMADKYNYSVAYTDVFFCLTNYYVKNEDDVLLSLDEDEKRKALKYLMLAGEKEEPNALKLLAKYYSEGVYLPKDEIKAKVLLLKFDSIISK